MNQPQKIARGIIVVLGILAILFLTKVVYEKYTTDADSSSSFRHEPTIEITFPSPTPAP